MVLQPIDEEASLTERQGLLIVTSDLRGNGCRSSSGARRAAAENGRSRRLKDAIHLVTAERAEADLFLTFNLEDFSRLRIAASPRVIAPPDPPGLHP